MAATTMQVPSPAGMGTFPSNTCQPHHPSTYNYIPTSEASYSNGIHTPHQQQHQMNPRDYRSPVSYNGRTRTESPVQQQQQQQQLLTSPYESNPSTYTSAGMGLSAHPTTSAHDSASTSPTAGLPSIGQGSMYGGSSFQSIGRTQNHTSINTQPHHHSPHHSIHHHDPYSPGGSSHPHRPHTSPAVGHYYSTSNHYFHMAPTAPSTSSMMNRPILAPGPNFPPPLHTLQPQYRHHYPLPGMGPSMLGGILHHGLSAHHPLHHHPQQDRPFKCDQCPQSFSRNHDLKRHKRIHLAVKPFPCDNCDKSFSRKDALKRHRLVKGCGKASERKQAQAAAAAEAAKNAAGSGSSSSATMKIDSFNDPPRPIMASNGISITNTSASNSTQLPPTSSLANYPPPIR